MKQAIIKETSLSKIKPYWRNPRENRSAADKVRESIKKFGYNQLICVDTHNVIIVGHARFLALKELGYDIINVLEADLSSSEAKQYRIIDNKTSEFAVWTDDLSLELREIGDTDFMSQFFMDKADLSFGMFTQQKDGQVTASQIETAREAMGTQIQDRMQNDAAMASEIACPSCGHTFQARLNVFK